MKKTLAFLLIIALLVTVFVGCEEGETAAPSSTDEQKSFSFTAVSYVSVEGSAMNETLAFLQKRMAEVSDGRITVNVPAGGSMGNITELIQMVQLGELDVAYSDDLTIDTVIGGIGWAFLPYVCKSY